MNSVIDSSKWELESALARKNGELEELQRSSNSLQASVKKLEAELNQLQANAQLQLNSCKRACDDKVSSKDAELKDIQMKVDKLQGLLDKQVSTNDKNIYFAKCKFVRQLCKEFKGICSSMLATHFTNKTTYRT